MAPWSISEVEVLKGISCYEKKELYRDAQEEVFGKYFILVIPCERCDVY